MAAGIVSWGCYIAIHRLPLALLSGRAPATGPERAVAWADEDSVTMAVEAAQRCVVPEQLAEIDLLIFATTTHAFAEKQGGAVVAAALGLPPTVRTMDVSHSLRAGADALLIAHEAVESGRARHVLVVAADCRMGAPDSELERSGGDGAAAFMVGTENVAASLVGHAAYSEEILDYWRMAGEPFTHGWEKRFTTGYGFQGPALKAVQALPPRKEGVARTYATSAPDSGVGRSFLKAVGADGATLPDLYKQAGFCGAAHTLILLAAALDGPRVAQEIAVVAHGDGALALLFRCREGVTGNARPAVVSEALAQRIVIRSLAAYRKARGLEQPEYAENIGRGVSATIHYRERAENLALAGQRCQCGEPQFPRQRVCVRCKAKDHFVPEIFSHAGGRLVTYSLDAFFPSPTPPTGVGVVQVNNGPRIYMELAQLPESGPEIGMALSFVFRCIHRAGGRPNYFWKAVPSRERCAP